MHSKLCWTLVQYPTTRSSIWSVQGCPALISKDDIRKILFVISFCPFHSFKFMFFAKKWPFEGVFTLTMDWIEYLTMCRFPLFRGTCCIENSFTGWLFFWSSFSSNYEDHSEIFLGLPFRCFSYSFSQKKNKCLNWSVISTYYCENFVGSSSVPKQGSYSGTVPII